MSATPSVYVGGWNAVTPLGHGIGDLFDRMAAGESACRVHNDPGLYPEPFCASLFGPEFVPEPGFSKLETLLLQSLRPILSETVARSPRTVFIFSSTKGNIDSVIAGKTLPPEAFLWHTAQKIATHYGNPVPALCVSNACVSGIMAQNLGFDLLRAGRYDHAVVFGADLVTDFVLSGFGSFKAMSAEPARPFDKNRTGINLGEGAAALILSTEPGTLTIRLTGTGSGNDANHISGPSRTGDGLAIAIRAALDEAGLQGSDMDYLSAHGTATPYNDEMESLAFADTGLSQVPLNSLKGYIGHTLGAAGLIETAVLLESLRRQTLLASPGYAEHGVTGEIRVLTHTMPATLRKAIKTGSGFGGCNAASVFEYEPSQTA